MIQDAKESGAKFDDGKIRADLVLSRFANALEAVSRVGTFGANKYSKDGWLRVENGIERYKDAMMRHWLADAAGEEFDKESGMPHLAHHAWNALAVLELTIRDKGR